MTNLTVSGPWPTQLGSIASRKLVVSHWVRMGIQVYSVHTNGSAIRAGYGNSGVPLKSPGEYGCTYLHHPSLCDNECSPLETNGHSWDRERELYMKSLAEETLTQSRIQTHTICTLPHTHIHIPHTLISPPHTNTPTLPPHTHTLPHTALPTPMHLIMFSIQYIVQ